MTPVTIGRLAELPGRRQEPALGEFATEQKIASRNKKFQPTVWNTTNRSLPSLTTFSVDSFAPR